MNQTTNGETSAPPKMIGSMHRFIDGYGYGTRVETSRNIAGPRAVPKYRYPPSIEDDMQKTRSMPCRLVGAAAERRTEENRARLTSGQYGDVSSSALQSIGSGLSYKGGKNLQESTSYNSTPPESSRKTYRSEQSVDTLNQLSTARSIAYDGKNTEQMPSSRSVSSTNSTAFYPRKIDPVFGRSAKCDLLASQRLETGRQEKLLNIAYCQRESEQCEGWSRALRVKR
eukprot:gene2706-5328_t